MVSIEQKNYYGLNCGNSKNREFWVNARTDGGRDTRTDAQHFSPNLGLKHFTSFEHRSLDFGPIQYNLRKGLTICTLIEIVCLPVLIFTYSHVENALFFALDLVVFCNSNYFFKHTNWYTLTSGWLSKLG